MGWDQIRNLLKLLLVAIIGTLLAIYLYNMWLDDEWFSSLNMLVEKMDLWCSQNPFLIVGTAVFLELISLFWAGSKWTKKFLANLILILGFALGFKTAFLLLIASFSTLIPLYFICNEYFDEKYFKDKTQTK